MDLHVCTPSVCTYLLHVLLFLPPIIFRWKGTDRSRLPVTEIKCSGGDCAAYFILFFLFEERGVCLSKRGPNTEEWRSGTRWCNRSAGSPGEGSFSKKPLSPAICSVIWAVRVSMCVTGEVDGGLTERLSRENKSQETLYLALAATQTLFLSLPLLPSLSGSLSFSNSCLASPPSPLFTCLCCKKWGVQATGVRTKATFATLK